MSGHQKVSIFGKMRLGVWWLAMGLATPVLGEAVPREGPVETPSGTLVVSELEGSDAIVLRLGEQVLMAEGNSRDVSLINRIGDMVLVYVSFGRSACPGAFIWLHTGHKDVRMSERFGTCSDEVLIRTVDGEVLVSMARLSEGSGLVEFAYDGQRIERREIQQKREP